MSADVIAAMVVLLKADAGVAALAGTRVFGGELPPDETEHMPRKAIVVQPAGGTSLTAGSYARHESQRVDVFAYGETPHEAGALEAAAHGALKQIRRAVAAATMVHWADPAGGYFADRDTDTAWPTAWRSYQVFFASQPAA